MNLKCFKSLFRLSLIGYFFVGQFAWAMINPNVEDFDLRYYHPAKYNLKDLVFEVRISDLAEKLTKRKSFGEITDVYYKVYWIFPGQYRIVVNGLPRGFNDLKVELKNILKSRLELVIPQTLSPKVRSYSLSSEKKKDGGTLVTGIDKTYTKAASRIQLQFGKSGKLKYFKTFSPRGVNNSEMEMGVKAWSHNKWVLNKMTVSKTQGPVSSSMESNIEYTAVGGFGFPHKVDVKTIQKVSYEQSTSTETFGGVSVEKIPKEKKKETTASIVFSKYEVNTGKAKRYIVKGQKR